MYQLMLNEKDILNREGILDQLMDTLFDVSILVDSQCRIIYISKGSYSLLSKRESLIGQHISVVDNVSPFSQVIETGQAVTGLLLELKGKKTVSNIFPILDNNQVIGALGTILFRSLSPVKKIFSQLNQDTEKGALGELYHNIARLDSQFSLDDYIGETSCVQDLISKAKKAAASNFPILLIGETGTGKEIIASGIHAARHPNNFTPYVTINCTAIPEALIESELFGHEKGAFTDAKEAKNGKFELAENGDILLDEIGDMALPMQSKLLRVLESKEFERVGGHNIIPMRANIIASTNKNLLQMSKHRAFRADLYYRLSTIELYFPPLRNRKSDIPLLLEHFIKNSQGTLRFTSEAIRYLTDYSWPGNVRQLKNLVNRWLVYYDGKQITGMQVVDELTIGQSNYNQTYNVTSTPITQTYNTYTPQSLEAVECNSIMQTLNYTEQNISEAAKILGITRSTLYQKMKKYNL